MECAATRDNIHLNTVHRGVTDAKLPVSAGRPHALANWRTPPFVAQ
jgi:hypothetical protein